MTKADPDASPPPWQWPGLWSLNLPVIAVLWQALFARMFFVHLSAHHYFITAGLVWAIVVGERWLYFFRLAPAHAGRAIRGKETVDGQASVLRLVAVVMFALLAIAFFRGTPRETGGLLILISLAGTYLLGLAATGEKGNEFLAREMGLPALLCATLLLPIWANSAFPPFRLLLPALLLLLLFFYHLALVGRWSSALLPLQQGSALLNTPLGVIYRVLPLTMIFAGAALALVTRGFLADPLLLSLGMSGLLLLLLDAWEKDLPKAQARLFADLALVTPLMPLVLLF